jgi:hypothetical protein
MRKNGNIPSSEFVLDLSVMALTRVKLLRFGSWKFAKLTLRFFSVLNPLGEFESFTDLKKFWELTVT